MSILITGGAGYIGRHTASRLQKAGLEVVALDNLSSSQSNHFPWGSLVVGELSNTELVASLLRRYRVTAVIHLAASAHVGESMTQPYLYFQNNIAATLNLLDAMLKERVLQIVFASTCAVYGAQNCSPARECGPVDPGSPYGESKLQIERALPWYARAHGLNFIGLRYFNVAGAEDGLGEDLATSVRIIPRTIYSVRNKSEHLSVYGSAFSTPDGTAVRDYVHVSDVCRANLLALDYLERGKSGAVINIASGVGTSIRQIIEATSAEMNTNVEYRTMPARHGDQPSIVGDVALAKTVLAWEPRESELQMIITSITRARSDF